MPFDLIPYEKLLSSSLDGSGATWYSRKLPRTDPVVSGSSRFEPVSDTRLIPWREKIWIE